jgi:bifunctional UDP-N-acetylglucosamine pyrophosphorylase/glucosamine-1-phosphate N-acetyltransferase
VRKACEGYPEVRFVRQKEQKGTGDAVLCAEGELSGKKGVLVVLSGDVILLEKDTVQGLLQAHNRSEAACTVGVASLKEPKGYGRILRDGKKLAGIREEADCSIAEREIHEVNSGLYCFDLDVLFTSLRGLDTKNAQGEFYLTDAVVKLTQSAGGVELFSIENAEEMLGINDRVALSEVEKKVQARVNRHWMLEGVTMRDPGTIWIDSATKLGKDITIEGPAVLRGAKVADGVHIKPGCYIEGSELGENVTIGPYAHVRPGSVLEKGVKIGNFVEIKKSRMGQGAKASHLSYIGDADIGKNVNLGCGFITCNYDGVSKFKTTIEDDVFVGSDSQTVAPVKIGKGSYVASGTTVTRDVPADSLVIARVKQEIKEGYAARLKARQARQKPPKG